MAQMPKSMDLLISKQKKTKNSVLDPRKVRIILRFDTPELGDMAVEMDVLDKQVWTVFYSKTLKLNCISINYLLILGID